MPPANIDKLLSPVKLGVLELRNRFVMSAMTRNRGFIPNAINQLYYRQRATEAGLILTEGTLIELQGSEWPYAPGLFRDDQVVGWKAVTEAVHEEGGLIVAQLWHLGRVLHPLHQGGKPVYGPSAVKAKGGKFRLLHGEPGYQTPTPIDNPEDFIALYRAAAVAAKAAGFDGVQLHSANGYLPNQFLDARSNQREDKWGGSVENRCRFSLRCIDELIDVWGAERVGIKLTPAGGYNDMGFGKQGALDTFSHLIQQLSTRRIAFIEMMRVAPGFLSEGAVQDLDVVKELVPFSSVPVLMNGGYDAQSAVDVITSTEGKVAAVSFGRPFLANPDLPTRYRNDLQLNNADVKTFYTHPEGQTEKGYTDYPFTGMREALKPLVR